MYKLVKNRNVNYTSDISGIKDAFMVKSFKNFVVLIGIIKKHHDLEVKLKTLSKCMRSSGLSIRWSRLFITLLVHRKSYFWRMKVFVNTFSFIYKK